MGRVDVVLELHEVVERSELHQPCEALDVGVERVEAFGRPRRSQRISVGLRAERVRLAEHLVVDEAPAECVAKRAAVSPIPGDVQPLAVEVGVPDAKESNERMPGADRGIEHQRDFVARLDEQRDAAGRVGNRAHRRLGDERLRAQNAL